MLDTAGRPVCGQSVGVSLDLRYGSHTGMGGMILWQGATTNRTGRFHLRHVHPNVITVRATDGPRCPPYWIRTRVRGRWEDKIEDEITPRTGGGENPADYERAIDLRLLVSHQPLYRYFGRVRGGTGLGDSNGTATSVLILGFNDLNHWHICRRFFSERRKILFQLSPIVAFCCFQQLGFDHRQDHAIHLP